MEIAHLSNTTAAHRAHRLPIRVYYEDTDAGGVVYHANYLKFCERARTEWLRDGNFSQSRLLQEQSLAFMVRRVQADYLASACLDDQLEVLTRIDTLGHASIVFSQEVACGGKVLFQAKVTVACVDLKRQKPVPIPADIRTQMETMQ